MGLFSRIFGTKKEKKCKCKGEGCCEEKEEKVEEVKVEEVKEEVKE